MLNFFENVYMFHMHGHTFISTQPLQDLRFATLCGNPYRWRLICPSYEIEKKEDATWPVHCVYVGGVGSLMYFEIENKEHMKSFGEYLKFQSLIYIPETIRL